MSDPTTNDAPDLFLVLPDWSKSIKQGISYRTDISRSAKGLEQRSQRRRRPVLRMSYQADRQRESGGALGELQAETRGPIRIPWWPHGIMLRTDMADTTTAALASAPLVERWSATGFVFLHHPKQGGEIREISLGNGTESLVFVDDGDHIQFQAGSYCYPMIDAVRDADPSALRSQTHQSRTETINVREL